MTKALKTMYTHPTMANHASAIKRNRQNDKRQTYNRWWKSRVREATKSVLEAPAGSDDAKTKLSQAMKEISKAANKGVLHKKTASRKIARLSKAATRVQA